MQYSKDGLHLTEQFESCRLTAYQDVKGIWTIGWGHTEGVKPGMTITQSQAEEFLADDVNWANNVVNSLVFASLTQGEHDALVDFVFNVGSGNFAHSTMMKWLNEKNMVMAALEFEKWDQAGGKVVAGLLRRREAEQLMFTSTTT
jgi:lysozyme